MSMLAAGRNSECLCSKLLAGGGERGVPAARTTLGRKQPRALGDKPGTGSQEPGRGSDGTWTLSVT